MLELVRTLGRASVGEGPLGLLGELADAFGGSAAALWVPRRDHLLARETWAVSRLDREAVDRTLRSQRIARNVGLAGRAWERGAPLDWFRAERPQRRWGEDRHLDGLRETVAFPCSDGDEVLAVVEIYGPARIELSDRLVEILIHAGRIMWAFLARRRGELGLSPLSAREVEVLALAGRGLSVRETAASLTISPATVKTHLEHVYRKLGVRDRTSAVAVGLRSGFIA